MRNKLHSFVISNTPGISANCDPDASLVLNDDDRGFVPNRLTTAQRNAIPSPRRSLLIYNTDTDTYQYYNGTSWVAIGTGAGGLQFITVPLSTNDINHMFSTPKTLIAAPGAGKVLIPSLAIFTNHVGSISTGGIFASAGNLVIRYGSSTIYVGGDFGTFESNVSAILSYPCVLFSSGSIPTAANLFNLSPNYIPYSLLENTALVLTNSVEDYVNYGAIATTSKNAGGSGYISGDTGTVSENNLGNGATYHVDTVDGGGAVLTYHLTTNGYGFPTATNNVSTQATSGAGTGFILDINTITPGNGSGSVLLSYYVLTLP